MLSHPHPMVRVAGELVRHDVEESKLSSEQSPQILGPGAAGAPPRWTGGLEGGAGDQLGGVCSRKAALLCPLQEGVVSGRGPTERMT